MSLIARHLEALGIPTLCLASAKDIIEAGQPPRAVFIDYPLGHTTGKPFDPTDQYEVLRDAIGAFSSFSGPGELLEAERRWSDNDDWQQTAMDPSGGDTRQARDTSPQYQTEDDRRLAEGA